MRDLLDSSLPPQEVESIDAELRGHPEVKGIPLDPKTRKSGGRPFLEFHVVVDAQLPTIDAHRLAHHLTARIRTRFPNAVVTTHIEPCDGSCHPACREGCLLSEADRDAARAAFVP